MQRASAECPRVVARFGVGTVGILRDLLARTQPAEPAPTMTKSASSSAAALPATSELRRPATVTAGPAGIPPALEIEIVRAVLNILSGNTAACRRGVLVIAGARPLLFHRGAQSVDLGPW